MNHRIQNAREFISALPLSDHKIITIVGAGGKTTLLYALAERLSKRNKNILLTTTTHIKRPSEALCLSGWSLVEKEDKTLLSQSFSEHSVVCLGIPVQKQPKNQISGDTVTNKWHSPTLPFLENIQSIPDYILCEGDGSKRLPVKIPRENEPVLFPGTELVLGIIGLSCLDRPIEDTLFGWKAKENQDFFYSLLRTTEGKEHRITPYTLFHIATSHRGLQKATTNLEFHVIFNQADLLSESQLFEIEKISQNIRDNGTPCHIVSLK